MENGKAYSRTHDTKILIKRCIQVDKDLEYLLEIEAGKPITKSCFSNPLAISLP